MSDLTSILERLLSVAGEDFDSRDCRVTNPRITARESIVIADYIIALQTEHDHLAAQVEHYNLCLAQESHQRQQRIDELEQWIAAIADDHPQIPGWIQQSARSLLAKEADMALEYAPAQYLAEIKAQAGRDGVVYGLNYFGRLTDKVSDEIADVYANQLRQSAKGGE